MKTRICGIAKCGEPVAESIGRVVDRAIDTAARDLSRGDVLVLELICRLRIERAIETDGAECPPSVPPPASRAA